MEESDTRACTGDNCHVAGPRAPVSNCERTSAVLARGNTESPLESSRKDLMAPETSVRCNRSHLSTARQEFVRGSFELQSERVLLRRFAEQHPKSAVEMKRGPSGAIGNDAQVAGSLDHLLNHG